MNAKKIATLAALVAMILPGIAFADVTIMTIVDGAVRTAFYIADGVIVILWVVTGILFLSGQGAPEKMGLARKALIFSVVGTLVILIANSAVFLVGNALNVPVS